MASLTDKVSSYGASCACVLHQENPCNTAIQVALAILAVAGVTIAALSYGGYLPSTLGNAVLGCSAIPLVFLGIFRSYTSTALDREIDQCRSYKDLDKILKASTMRVSCLGKRHLSGDRGSTTVDRLAKRVEEIMEEHLVTDPALKPKTSDVLIIMDGEIVRDFWFTGKVLRFDDPEEKNIGYQVACRIATLFDESETIIHKNFFTKACYYFPRFYLLICYKDLRERYRPYEGVAGTLSGCDEPGYEHRVPRCWTFDKSVGCRSSD